jgi:MFS family permease
MLLGAPFWGMFSDKMGRKLGFFCAVVITAIFGLASGFSPSLGYLLVFRAIVGFGLAGTNQYEKK